MWSHELQLCTTLVQPIYQLHKCTVPTNHKQPATHPLQARQCKQNACQHAADPAHCCMVPSLLQLRGQAKLRCGGHVTPHVGTQKASGSAADPTTTPDITHCNEHVCAEAMHLRSSQPSAMQVTKGMQCLCVSCCAAEKPSPHSSCRLQV
jgi:hypothetical protein